MRKSRRRSLLRGLGGRPPLKPCINVGSCRLSDKADGFGPTPKRRPARMYGGAFSF